MKSAHYEKQNAGQITSGLVKQDNLVLRTIHFVREHLPAWRDDPARSFEQSEFKLNSQLCDFLDSCASSAFPMVRFKHEELQSGHSSVDLSAKPIEPIVIEARLYSIYDPIIVFECKRLPAPASDREKEYVTGGKDRKSGGIQRYKLGLHGSAFHLAVMIGYIQKRSAREWHQDINKWIFELCSGMTEDGCDWTTNETLELLEEDVAKGILCCRSVHGRANSRLSSEIEIQHLWVLMNRQ